METFCDIVVFDTTREKLLGNKMKTTTLIVGIRSSFFHPSAPHSTQNFGEHFTLYRRRVTEKGEGGKHTLSAARRRDKSLREKKTFSYIFFCCLSVGVFLILSWVTCLSCDEGTSESRGGKSYEAEICWSFIKFSYTQHTSNAMNMTTTRRFFSPCCCVLSHQPTNCVYSLTRQNSRQPTNIVTCESEHGIADHEVHTREAEKVWVKSYRTLIYELSSEPGTSSSWAESEATETLSFLRMERWAWCDKRQLKLRNFLRKHLPSQLIYP